MGTIVRELRYAWRSLCQRPAYFVTCSATLALVLGAMAAILAVVNATMLRPLPFATRAPVVHLFNQPPGTTSVLQRNPLQQMEVPRLRERTRTLARLEGFYPLERVVTLAGEPSVVKAATVTPGLFAMLDAPVAQGRPFKAEEGGPGHFVAMISDRYWRGALGGRDVLGTTLVVDDQIFTVIGVLSPAFAVPFLDADVFTPLVPQLEAIREPARTVVALAELAPGASIEQVRDELAAISGQWSQELPRTHSHWQMGAQTVRQWQYGSMRAPLLMLMAAAGLVLLIACVNIANLTTAHAVARSGELALRLALGASAHDVARTLCAELLIISVAGLIPGLLLATAAVPALLAVHPTIAQTIGPVTVDWRVQALSAAVGVLVAAAASALPALRAGRLSASAVMSDTATRTTGSARVDRVQRALVSIEVALSVALLMAGWVVIEGLRELSVRGPGYQSSGVLTAQIRLPGASYPSPQSRTAVVEGILDELTALPGVVSAGITQNAFVPTFSYQTLIRVKDRPTPDGQAHTVQYRRVSSDYFATMGINTVAGRVFTDADTADRAPVAVVSRQFADLLMPGLDPIGRELLRNNPPPVTIVGVVDDASDVTAAEPAEPTLYVAWPQNNNFGVPVAFVIRTTVEPASLIPAVREVVRRADPALPLRKPQTLDTFVRESTAPQRFRIFVLGILAGLGVVLAVLGIGGVTYRAVVDRTKEFAVRLALGAGPGAVLRLVLGRSLRDIGVGSAAGVGLGLAACSLMAQSLDNVAALNGPGVAVPLAIVVLAGFAAALVPALRIMRVRPATVLRS